MAGGEFVYSVFPGEQVAYSSGTSFAAPIVSGAYALALGQKALTLSVLDSSLSSSLLKVSGNPKGTLQIDAFIKLALTK
jgi:subtilisin family serine protease